MTIDDKEHRRALEKYIKKEHYKTWKIEDHKILYFDPKKAPFEKHPVRQYYDIQPQIYEDAFPDEVEIHGLDDIVINNADSDEEDDSKCILVLNRKSKAELLKMKNDELKFILII